MAVKRKYRLNLRNYGNLPAIMLSQYDEGYALEFEIRDGTEAASDLSAYTVTLKGTRADTLAYSFSGTIATNATNVLTFVIDTTMTACAGRGTAEIAIKDTANDVLFATFNMPVFVERAAVPEGSIDADVERAQEIAEQVQEIVDNAAAAVSGEAERWATGQINGTDVPSTDPAYENNAKYYAEQAADSAASIGIDATLTQSGKAADAKKTGDEISELKEKLSDVKSGLNDLAQDIVDGKVSTSAGTEDILPIASDFRAAKIAPASGNIGTNGAMYFVVDGVGASYYTLISTDFLADDIKSIQNAYSSVRFVLLVYDRSTSEYLGAIYTAYTFKSKEDLGVDNKLYPYTVVDMDALRATFPSYKYKIAITDTAVNRETHPVASDILLWCKYTVPSEGAQRQLVKTVNGVQPDNNGDIDLDELNQVKDAVVYSLFGFDHQGYYINTSGQIVERSGSDWGYTDSYYSVNPSTEYFLKITDSVFVAEYTSDKTFIKCTGITAGVAKFTATATTAYIRISAKVADWIIFAMSTTPFFGNYDMASIDGAIDRKTGEATKGKLYGKKIVFFGDSITGNYAPPTDYPSILAEATGATVYNAGFGGTCMSDNGETIGLFSFCRLIDAVVDNDWTDQDSSGFVRNYIGDTEYNYVPDKLAMLKSINWSEIDYVITLHGTNDWGKGYAIDNANNLYDTTTYAGAFRYAFEKLQTAYPNIKIIPLTPLTRISHEGSVYYDSNEYDKGTGQYLYQFANKMVDVSENKYFTKPCDLYHSCMITKWNWRRYLMDGIHPLAPDGQKWVSDLITAFFNSYI